MVLTKNVKIDASTAKHFRATAKNYFFLKDLVLNQPQILLVCLGEDLLYV